MAQELSEVRGLVNGVERSPSIAKEDVDYGPQQLAETSSTDSSWHRKACCSYVVLESRPGGQHRQRNGYNASPVVGMSARGPTLRIEPWRLWMDTRPYCASRGKGVSQGPEDTVILTEQLLGASIRVWHLAQRTIRNSLRERDPIH